MRAISKFEKRVTGGSYTRCRLDQALVSAELSAQYPEANLKHETATSCDHCPILFNLRGDNGRPPAKPPFRYEVMWESHETWRDTIAQHWSMDQSPVTMEGLREKLNVVSNNLGRWNRETFGSVRKEIKHLNSELHRLQGEPTRVGPTHAELKINERLVELYHQEE